jgi:CRISPR/Cas system CSM-associated protein Csm3 (group 7 of RAMP superfamily)
MTNLHIRLTFLEPFRLVEWTAKDRRNGKNPAWVRAQGFARWHGKGWGRPYVTGTLLRSAVIRAVEEELARSDGKWKWVENAEKQEISCCQGEFFTRGGDGPVHLRHRSTIGWGSANIPLCKDRQSACPLCHILGRLNTAGKKLGKNDVYDVRFGNLRLAGGKTFAGPGRIGDRRILNRIDAPTGKAHDWFRIWEIDDEAVKNFEGVIAIGEDLPQREAVVSLLERALGFVDRICGSMVTVDVKREDIGITECEKTKPPDQQDKEQTADPIKDDRVMPEVEKIVALIPDNDSEFPKTKLRTLADAVRALRAAPLPLALPKGHEGRDGRPGGHFLWDKLKLRDGRKTLRGLLEGAAKTFANDPAGWRRFCECLGQKLYEGSKGPNQARSEGGGRQADDVGLVIRPKRPVSYSDSFRTGVTFTHEWILIGELRAKTPFHVGVKAEDGDQTSLRVLLGRDNRFRLPRSTLRGVLRRDLGLVTGQGCLVQLGPERPCQCPVCRIMRQVVIRDAKSDVTLPPDIRHRIRRNHVTGTVDEGALFDAESGMEGMTFPFVLRFRGDAGFPKDLRKVLTWWEDGKLFLGGDVGTGKGRFALEGLQPFCWDLAEDKARADYAEQYGLRGQEGGLDAEMVGIAEGLDLVHFDKESHDHPWQEVQWSLSFTGPILSNDPIAALCQDEADAIFYRKTLIEHGNPTPVFALRGEGLRGLVRTAQGRAAGGLLGRLHEDCTCPLCLVFGNEHQAGSIRFEDMTAEAPQNKLVDHVSIDRFDGGVVEKFDDRPLIGSRERVLEFKGSFWLLCDLEKHSDAKESLAAAFRDIRAGLYPVGAKGGIGYGWVKGLAMTGAPDWLLDSEQSSVPTGGATPDDLTAPSGEAYPPLPAFAPKAGGLYNPYYFLKVDEDVKVHREQKPISHESFDSELLTGKITCTLKALSPLILPDAEGGTQDPATNHRTFPFFRIGDEEAIPASQIRAAVSSVFEALTNSCFRVMKQKNYLSWRMEAEGDQSYLPGRVMNGGKQIKPMGEKAIRLPLYDDPNATSEIGTQHSSLACLSNRDEKLDKALVTNSKIAAAAKHNQDYLDKLSEEDSKDVLLGKTKVKFWTESLADNDDMNFWIAKLGDHGKETKSGFLKITGPNNANVANISDGDAGYREEWENPMDYSFRLIGPPICQPNTQKREFPRPGFKCVKDGKEYRVTKRCERIFEDVGRGVNYGVPAKVRDQYRDVLIAYRGNAKDIAKAFQTRLPDENEPDCNDLRDGDLVYLKLNDAGRVDAIIPVCISREADDRRIGERLPERYRPCARVCLADCTKCDAKFYELPLYREGALADGLCPACHLFGAAGYKGRIRFGLGRLREESTKTTSSITLPLQERPRPTWVLPIESKGKSDATIPGRKFYLRHDGWKGVLSGKDPITSETISHGKNNITSEAIMAGAEFTFEIHFENLFRWELGLFLYCLELEPGMAHMLGRGKPLGFGQVSIKVDAVQERTPDGQWRKWTASGSARGWNITWEGLHHLVALCGGKSEETEWHRLPHVAPLRLLLTRHENIRACYPALTNNDPPGYVELKNSGYKAGQKLRVKVKIEEDEPSATMEPWHVRG